MPESEVLCERLGVEEWFWELATDCWTVAAVGVMDCRASGSKSVDCKRSVLQERKANST